MVLLAIQETVLMQPLVRHAPCPPQRPASAHPTQQMMPPQHHRRQDAGAGNPRTLFNKLHAAQGFVGQRQRLLKLCTVRRQLAALRCNAFEQAFPAQRQRESPDE